MYIKFVEDLRCPISGGKLQLEEVKEQVGENILTGSLIEQKTGTRYPIERAIPRFVSNNNYAASFGIEWNMFPKVQLDSVNGTTISKDRFFAETGWEKNLKGQRLLEVGCGMGRFTEIAVATGAECYSFDYSNAVDAAYGNLGAELNLCQVQASLYQIPFPENFFDKIFCFGVLQHTPDVKKSFSSLVPFLKAGGHLAMDVYAAPYNWFHPRKIFRPLTKRMEAKTLHNLVKKTVPLLLKLSNLVAALPKVGPVLKYGVPVANYKGRFHLSNEQIKQWAILDTYDWYSPQYDKPQLGRTVWQWFKEHGFVDIEIARNVGIYMARGRKK